ncbi:IS701 family transposase [Nonomuraea phyllanthi]|uniref:IS701 family transposase n=1 Tax=Nonomuraea phyllanthi TaxID=2219224 RepID=A0A5C4UV43_9ACTN|nr:IS701 family transposase [Nonomuraea phyllanthi]KAB8182668.1 IS701 family transposase [Nonomuraea phyllanthi]
MQRHRRPDRELPDRGVPRLGHPTRPGPAGSAALPPEHTWLADPDRCQAAGVPDEIAFATKPALATQMILAALDAGVPACWVTGDEVYGQDPCLRAALEARRIGYVLAIAGNRRVDLEGVQVSAAEVATRVADRHWHRYCAGQGGKGPRWYAWAWARIDESEMEGYRWLLIRRNLTTGELAFYRCYAPTRQPLMTLVKIAGSRWAVEESFQAAKSQVGLDHYQVRGWTAWHRHIVRHEALRDRVEVGDLRRCAVAAA